MCCRTTYYYYYFCNFFCYFLHICIFKLNLQLNRLNGEYLSTSLAINFQSVGIYGFVWAVLKLKYEDCWLQCI